MAETKILLNKCLDVTQKTVALYVSPRDSALKNTLYWFQAFWTQSDALNPTKGEMIELGEESECRVIVWDNEPVAQDVPKLEGNGSEDPSIVWAFGPEGSATVIDNLKDDDPWPRRGTKKGRSKRPSKPAARKAKAKPAARKAKSKPAARKVKKPAAKKAAPRKAVAKKEAPTKKKVARPSRRR